MILQKKKQSKQKKNETINKHQKKKQIKHKEQTLHEIRVQSHTVELDRAVNRTSHNAKNIIWATVTPCPGYGLTLRQLSF